MDAVRLVESFELDVLLTIVSECFECLRLPGEIHYHRVYIKSLKTQPDFDGYKGHMGKQSFRIMH
jgi:hypothetical protein